MSKMDALSLSYEDWVREMEALGEKRFRADQVCGWLYRRHVFEFQLMSDLSLELRNRLDGAFRVGLPKMLGMRASGRDGTKKFLFDFDGSSVESVAIWHPGRITACVSTQVGCPLGCPFCATGQSGFERNMTVGEMVGQFLAMEARLGEIKNLVFMGMGEPMLNYHNLIGAIRNLNHPKMRGLGIRHITVSTSGIIPGILNLAREGLGVRLAVSLHAPNDELRDQLVPINAQYPLKELKRALMEYQEITGDRITIEYSLFDQVNDSVPMARQLGEYLKGLSAFVNLIPGSCVGDQRFRPSPPFRVRAFGDLLTAMGYPVAMRQSKGSDVGGACGQLRRQVSPGIQEASPQGGQRGGEQAPKAPGPAGDSKPDRGPKGGRRQASASKGEGGKARGGDSGGSRRGGHKKPAAGGRSAPEGNRPRGEGPGKRDRSGPGPAGRPRGPRDNGPRGKRPGGAGRNKGR